MNITLNRAARAALPPLAAEAQSTRPNPGAFAGASGKLPGVLDHATLRPVPPRFPWLSRLSRELEPTAKQKPSFPAAPALGDHLNQSA